MKRYLLPVLAALLCATCVTWAQDSSLAPRQAMGTHLFQVTAPDPAIALNANGLTVMNADGTNQLNIYQPPKGACIKGANWSPDHSMLVFEMITNCSAGVPDGIYVINRDGSGLREVIALNNGVGLAYPVWSPQPAPDGNYKIAFSDQVTSCGATNLFLVNLDGTGLTNLTNTCSVNQYSQYYPSWDSSATRLGIQVYPCAVNVSCSGHLYVYDLASVNGSVSITGMTDLNASGGTMGGLWVYRSDWARTQDKIVFEARFLSNTNNSALFIVSLADPANPVELTATYNNGKAPSWSPDDSKIAFSRTVQRKATISVITADGSTVTDLATVGGSPAWRRCCPTCVIPCAP